MNVLLAKKRVACVQRPLEPDALIVGHAGVATLKDHEEMRKQV